MQSVFIPQQRPRPRVKPSRDRSPPWLQSRNLSSSSRLRLPRFDQLSVSTFQSKVSQKRIIWSTLGENDHHNQQHPSSRFRPNVQSHTTHLTSGSAHGALLDAGGGRSQPQLGQLPVSPLCRDNGLWRQRRLSLGRSREGAF